MTLFLQLIQRWNNLNTEHKLQIKTTIILPTLCILDVGFTLRSSVLTVEAQTWHSPGAQTLSDHYFLVSGESSSVPTRSEECEKHGDAQRYGLQSKTNRVAGVQSLPHRPRQHYHQSRVAQLVRISAEKSITPAGTQSHMQKKNK